MDLPAIASVETIQSRLLAIFPEGSENRNYLIREIAAKTVFVMLYTGAIEGADLWIRPDQVTKMNDDQAARTGKADRAEWTDLSLAPGKMKEVPNRWYAVNTREPIRDETLRSGLVMMGAVVERSGLPTTSSKPRYALNGDFARLFCKRLAQKEFEREAAKWREDYLSPAALARIRLRDRGAFAGDRTSQVLVRLPNGEKRRMEPGPSSVLTRAVVEDYDLAVSLGMRIQRDRNLPDIIMADIGPRNPLVVFIEVVVTDGAITRTRLESLLTLAGQGGFKKERIAFVTAFEDRSASAYRRLSSDLAWGSYAWFSTEPEHVVYFAESTFRLEALAGFLSSASIE